jgi:excisionase family DNA binding protein
MDELTLTLAPAAYQALVERVATEAVERIRAEFEASAHPYLTVDQAAKYLSCSRQRIYDLASSGRLPRVKEGRRVLFRRMDIDRLLH